MGKFTISDGIKLSFIVGILLVSLSIFYYFVVFIPGSERLKFERQNQEKQIRARCSQLATQSAVEFYKSRSKDNPNVFPPSEGRYLKPDYEDYYKRYLREAGLE